MRLDRIEREEEVLIAVIACADQLELNNTSLACMTMDVSEGGMKEVTDMPIPVRTKSGLRLDLSSVLYRLEGEVRWTQKEGDNIVGLLLDDNSPDFIPWTRMFQLDF